MFSVVFTNKRMKQEYAIGAPHNTYVDTMISKTFGGPYIPRIVDDICVFYGVNYTDISLDVGGDIGAIKLSYMVDKNGYRLHASDFDIWRRGDLDAWRVTLTGYLHCSWAFKQVAGQAVIKTEGDR